MKNRCLLVYRNEILLKDVITQLIQYHPSLEVTETQFSTDNQLLDEVRRIQPAVLLLVGAWDSVEYSCLFLLMRDFPNLRIVQVGPENNQVQVYQRREVRIGEISDLFTTLNFT